MTKIILSFFFIALISCGKNQTENALDVVDSSIVGGQTVVDSEFDNVVELRISSAKGMSICSGTIIAKDIVLTAAHCLSNEGSLLMADPANFRVILRVRMNGKVNAVALTPKYVLQNPEDRDSKHYSADFGLLKFESVDFSQYVKIVPLATKAELEKFVLHNKKVMLVGYGTREDGSAGTIMKKVETEVGRVDNDFIHLPHMDRNSRPGDSGGPAFIKNTKGEWLQVGITSYLTTVPLTGQMLESVYVRADKVQKFIDKNAVVVNSLIQLKNLFNSPKIVFHDEKGQCQSAKYLKDNLKALETYKMVWQEPMYIFDLQCGNTVKKVGFILLTSIENILAPWFDTVEMKGFMLEEGTTNPTNIKIKLPQFSKFSRVEIFSDDFPIGGQKLKLNWAAVP